jgi:hypothetical protein
LRATGRGRRRCGSCGGWVGEVPRTRGVPAVRIDGMSCAATGCRAYQRDDGTACGAMGRRAERRDGVRSDGTTGRRAERRDDGKTCGATGRRDGVRIDGTTGSRANGSMTAVVIIPDSRRSRVVCPAPPSTSRSLVNVAPPRGGGSLIRHPASGGIEPSGPERRSAGSGSLPSPRPGRLRVRIAMGG